MIQSGTLKHRIIFQQKTNVSDGMGSSYEKWSTFATRWAAIWPVKAMERIENAQEGQETTHRIKIRYLAGVTAQMRVLYGSRTFEINSVINPDEANRELEILATEET